LPITATRIIVVLLAALLLRGEVGHAGVQELVGAVAVDGGQGDGVAQTQGIELVNAGVHLADGVHFVHAKHHRLPGAQQHVGNVLVRGGDAGADFGQKHDHIRRGDGDLRLLAHKEQDFAVGRGLNAAGVHDVKHAAVPLALGVQPVPCHAGSVLHDGEPLSA
jgi:hypothetical protein